MAVLQILNWNANYWQRKNQEDAFWDYLDQLAPDVALLQEARPRPEYAGFIGETQPATRLSEATTFVWSEATGRRDWGSGVFTKNLPIRPVFLKTDYPGAVHAAEVKVGNEIITFISLYAMIDRWNYAITTLHRMLSDLTPLLDREKSRKVVLAGDFNASTQWDEKQSGESHRLLFERLKNFGMVDVLRRHYPKHVQTYRGRAADPDWQIDYVFASHNIADHIQDVEVVKSPEVLALSDHNLIRFSVDYSSRK